MPKVRSHSSRSASMKLPPPPTPALLNTRFTWSVSCSAEHLLGEPLHVGLVGDVGAVDA